MRHQRTRRALIAATAGLFTFSIAASAVAPTPYTPLPQAALRPVIIGPVRDVVADAHVEDDDDVRPMVRVPTVVASETRPPQPLSRPKVRTEAKETQSPASGDSIKGKASWYCKAGVSVCHYKYPPGRMVAAACLKLRVAMGKDWRGKYVHVTHLETGESVRVQLVDWCGSKDKTIDLYWEPMRRLGGTGVLRVRVSW